MLRFAPSPTGDMHIGNLRVAIFNYIISQQTKEPLLLRIDDTDNNRNIEEASEEIAAILNQFELKFDKMVYQSENIKFYRTMAMKLLSEKKAFSCFCTTETLDMKKTYAKKNSIAYKYDGTCEKLNDADVIDNENPFVVRIFKSKKDITFKDKIKGDITTTAKDNDSFVILRANKYPTYNFACSVDDMLFDISLVIRGSDHLSNTPKQKHILQELGYTKEIEYLHLPIILDISGKKMSKRDEHSSVKGLIEKGFLPQAIANYLISLGNQTPEEIFDINEAIKWFDINKLSKSSAKFDITKLRFINRAHIKKLDNDVLAGMINYSGKYMGDIAKLYLEEASTLQEIKSKLDSIFASKIEPAEFVDEFIAIKDFLSKQDLSQYETFDELKKDLSSNLNLNGKFLLKPLRYLLSGASKGPNLSDLYPLIKNYLKDIIR